MTTFLAWAAEPEHDDRKLMGAKVRLAAGRRAGQRVAHFPRARPAANLPASAHRLPTPRTNPPTTLQWILVLSLVWATALYYKRWKWAPIKSRRIIVDALH